MNWLLRRIGRIVGWLADAVLPAPPDDEPDRDDAVSLDERLDRLPQPRTHRRDPRGSGTSFL